MEASRSTVTSRCCRRIRSEMSRATTKVAGSLLEAHRLLGRQLDVDQPSLGRHQAHRLQLHLRRGLLGIGRLEARPVRRVHQRGEAPPEQSMAPHAQQRAGGAVGPDDGLVVEKEDRVGKRVEHPAQLLRRALETVHRPGQLAAAALEDVARLRRVERGVDPAEHLADDRALARQAEAGDAALAAHVARQDPRRVELDQPGQLQHGALHDVVQRDARPVRRRHRADDLHLVGPRAVVHGEIEVRKVARRAPASRLVQVAERTDVPGERRVKSIRRRAMGLPPELAQPLLVAPEQLEQVVQQTDEGVPVDRPLAGEARPLVLAERLFERVPGNPHPGTHLEGSANGPRADVHGRVYKARARGPLLVKGRPLLHWQV